MNEGCLKLEFAVQTDELNARIDHPFEHIVHNLDLLLGQVLGKTVLNVRVFEWFPAELEC